MLVVRLAISPHVGLILSSHCPSTPSIPVTMSIFVSPLVMTILVLVVLFKVVFDPVVWDFLLRTWGPWDRSVLDRLMFSCIPPFVVRCPLLLVVQIVFVSRHLVYTIVGFFCSPSPLIVALLQKVGFVLLWNDNCMSWDVFYRIFGPYCKRILPHYRLVVHDKWCLAWIGIRISIFDTPCLL